MLELRKTTPHQTVSLEACGGSVMLSLDDGKGHAFRQALDAHDAGEVLCVVYNAICACVTVCQGDLVVRVKDYGKLLLSWRENGDLAYVILESSDKLVFKAALESYCRMLMRPKGDEP